MAEAATGELRKDSDLLVDAFLREEQKGEAAAALFRAGRTHMAQLEAAVAAHAAEASARARLACRCSCLLQTPCKPPAALFTL